MKKSLKIFMSLSVFVFSTIVLCTSINPNNSLYAKNSEESLTFFNEVYKNFDKNINLYESKNVLDTLNYNYEIIDKDINDEVMINIYMNQNKMSDNIKLFFNKNNNINKESLSKITYTKSIDKNNNTVIINDISSKKTYHILKDDNNTIKVNNLDDQENFLFQ